MDRFAGFLIGLTDYSRFDNVLVTTQHFFNLVRVHVKSGHYDHVFEAIDYLDVTIWCDETQLTGLQPALVLQPLRQMPRALLNVVIGQGLSQAVKGRVMRIAGKTVFQKIRQVSKVFSYWYASMMISLLVPFRDCLRIMAEAYCYKGEVQILASARSTMDLASMSAGRVPNWKK